MNKQLASATHKLLTSIFKQARRWEQAILPSTYYTGCVHSILGQHFAVAVSASFFGYTIPLGIFGFFAQNQIQDFWVFLT